MEKYNNKNEGTGYLSPKEIKNISRYLNVKLVLDEELSQQLIEVSELASQVNSHLVKKVIVAQIPQINEDIRKQVNSIAVMLENINKNLSKEMRETVIKNIAPIQGLTMNLSRQLSEIIMSLNVPVKNMLKQINAIEKVVEIERSKIIEVINEIDFENLKKRLEFEEFSINEDGSLKHGKEIYTKEEVEDIVEEQLDKIRNSESSEIKAYFNQILQGQAEIKQGQKNDRIISILLAILTVLLPMFLSWVGGSGNVGQFNSNINSNVIKEVKRTISLNNELNEDEIKHLRMVKKEGLKVRKKRTINSEVVKELNFGRLVRIIEKKKNWALIEIEDNRGEIYKGWTHTRYLEKLDSRYK